MYICVVSPYYRLLPTEFLLLIHKVHRQYQKYKTYQVIHSERLRLEEYQRKEREYRQRNDLLYHLQLNERKGTSVALKAYSVGRNLTTVFEERYAPRYGYHSP
jgi:hypothetical protein